MKERKIKVTHGTISKVMTGVALVQLLVSNIIAYVAWRLLTLFGILSDINFVFSLS